jgi:hypothetical protein
MIPSLVDLFVHRSDIDILPQRLASAESKPVSCVHESAQSQHGDVAVLAVSMEVLCSRI